MPQPEAKHVFAILVHQNADMLLAFLRSLVRDAHAVDDLFQETMLVAWRKLDECDLERPFGPWLRGIAAKLVLKHRSKSARDLLRCSERIMDRIDQQIARLDAQPGDAFDDKLSGLHDCIDSLPVDHKQAIRMRYVDELTTEQAAERAELTYEAMKKRIQRARAMLLECLRGKGVLKEVTP